MEQGASIPETINGGPPEMTNSGAGPRTYTEDDQQ